jgi:hypothetical protein
MKVNQKVEREVLEKLHQAELQLRIPKGHPKGQTTGN